MIDWSSAIPGVAIGTIIGVIAGTMFVAVIRGLLGSQSDPKSALVAIGNLGGAIIVLAGGSWASSEVFKAVLNAKVLQYYIPAAVLVCLVCIAAPVFKFIVLTLKDIGRNLTKDQPRDARDD
jgi:hypothetical protein